MKSTAAAVNAKKNESHELSQLDSLKVGEGGVIERFEGPEPLIRRLMELGLIEDSQIEIAHQAPFGGDPIAVKVRGGLLALRRSEAQHVWVRRQVGR